MSGGRAWLLAARPHTLWAAAGPVLVGAGLALGDGVFRPDVFLATLVGALAIQVAANLANDASDARRGADSAGRIGPTRAVASGLLSERAVWMATWASFGVAALAGLYLAAVAGWLVLAVGVAAIVATLAYTGGPWPYGYHALGELFVFVFFGLVATVMSRYVYDRSAPAEAWLLAVPVGLLVTSILVVNNIRDIETDAVAGKRTLAVVLGREAAGGLFAALVAAAFAAIALFAVTGWAPPPTALALAAAPLAVPLIRRVRRYTAGPLLVEALKGTARLHALVAALLSAGAAWPS
ncbi:MAG: 1,4-dihydroxy-2-naphthoate polyprenyltransferase [Actinomycetota bacterium]|nr:1,4-dihydroxy-2-naphthoate polyprenyltransferase [Actinomycetota bacterium]